MSNELLRPQATTDALRARAEGRARNGYVNLRMFDEGVVTTMGATIDDTLNSYFLTVSEFDGPPGSPKDVFTGEIRVPIVFSIPEDVFSQYENPIIVVRRESMTPALNRWMPGQLQYRVPTYSSHATTFRPNTSYEKKGYDAVEFRQMAVPFDLDYTVSLIARHRGVKGGQRNQSHRILDHILQIYQPYTFIKLIDSIGDQRTYEATMENVAPLDAIPEVSERVIGFSLSLRIMAELDLSPIETAKTVTNIKIDESII